MLREIDVLLQIDSLLVSHVESSYLNTKYESRLYLTGHAKHSKFYKISCRNDENRLWDFLSYKFSLEKFRSTGFCYKCCCLRLKNQVNAFLPWFL